VGIIVLILNLLFYALLAWVILSWIPLPWGHPVRKVYDFLGRLIRPLLAPIERIVPPLRVGNAAVGFAPIILSVILIVLIELFD